MNNSGRPTNSAPLPGAGTISQQQSYSNTYQQQLQRPSSSTSNNAPLVHHHYGTNNNTSSSKGPIIMRNLDKPNGVGTQVRLMKNNVCLDFKVFLFQKKY